MTMRPSPLSRRLRWLLAGYGVSALGSGMLYPLTTLYLTRVRGFGPQGAGAYFALVAVTSIGVSPTGGWAADRLGARTSAVAGALLQASGAALLGMTTTSALLVASSVLVGAGNGVFCPALTPLVRGLAMPEERPRAFSARLVTMNLGIGLGAVSGGAIVARLGDGDGYPLLYALNAASYVVFAAVIRAVGPPPAVAPAADPRHGAARDGTRGYAAALGDRRFRRLLMAHTLLVLFGYSQLDSAVPVLLSTRLGVAAPVIGGLVTVNTAAVVALQHLVTRSTRGRARGTLLRSVGVAWAVAYTLIASGASVDPMLRVPLLGLFAVVFALGECLYAPSFQPMVTELSPERSTGRYGALAAMSWEVGTMAGPAVGIMLVAWGGLLPYWSVYCGGLLAASLLLAPLGSRSASRAGSPVTTQPGRPT